MSRPIKSKMPRATPIPIPALAPDESPFRCSLDVWVVKLELPVVLVPLNEELVVVRVVERTLVSTELPVDVRIKVAELSPDEVPAVLEVVVADTLAMEAEYAEQAARPADWAWATSDALQASMRQPATYPPIVASLAH
jgi:hypothetical protein